MSLRGRHERADGPTRLPRFPHAIAWDSEQERNCNQRRMQPRLRCRATRRSAVLLVQRSAFHNLHPEKRPSQASCGNPCRRRCGRLETVEKQTISRCCPRRRAATPQAAASRQQACQSSAPQYERHFRAHCLLIARSVRNKLDLGFHIPNVFRSLCSKRTRGTRYLDFLHRRSQHHQRSTNLHARAPFSAGWLHSRSSRPMQLRLPRFECSLACLLQH
mmetsp:Transcript_100718/g.323407  ORF Transcript_100718/g.323407 Transcript_100718/m.323407 type:complete len:218 (-) Transcript_100718:93-746(-)